MIFMTTIFDYFQILINYHPTQSICKLYLFDQQIIDNIKYNKMGCESSTLIQEVPLRKSEQKIAYIEEDHKHTERQDQPVQYLDFSQMLGEISEELKRNQALYNQLLDIKDIQKIIDQISKRYRSHSQAAEMITMITDFLSYCKNRQSCNPPLKSTFTGNYQEQLALRWQKLREPSYQYNKGHLKLLNYIVNSPKSGQKEYDHCFQSLKFNMSIEEARKVAAVVKKMCNQDIRSFSYLSNYFYNSCVNLDKANLSIRQIEGKYMEILNQLAKENPPAPPIKFKEGQLEVHPSFNDEKLIPKIVFNMRQFKTDTDKQFGLQAFIMNRAEESMQQLQRFNQIISEICSNNSGFHFKSGVKIKSRQQTKALTRIKEKMLGGIYKQAQLEKSLATSKKDESMINFIDLYSYSSQQYAEYQKKMKKIFSKAKEPIPFKVSDLLRGKCVFTSVEKINKCCQDIKDEIKKREGEGLKLIEIDNRLGKGNSDLVMKILFGNTIAELQLVKDLDTAQYEFSHKLYQLQRSKFFTSLTQLSILNQDISKDYFNQIRAIILMNLDKSNDYNQKITYEQPLRAFKEFHRKLEIKINFLETHPNEIDVEAMREEQKRIKEVFKAKVNYQKDKQDWTEAFDRLQNSGIYHLKMKEHQKAEKEFEQAKDVFEKNNSELIERGKTGKPIVEEEKSKLEKYLNNLEKEGDNYQQMGKYQKALASYNTKYTIQQRVKGKDSIDTASTFNGIGLVHKGQGNYALALENYFKSLEIQQRIKGKGSIDTAQTFNNIGDVYKDQGNYALALENYLKCLEIQQRIKGKGNIDTANTFNSIGKVYKGQGNNGLALENYLKCLEIQQMIKGKGNIDTAITLNYIGDVYNNQGNYALALENFLKSLEIQQRIKGKGSIDTAITLNYIGDVYNNQGNYALALKDLLKSLEIQQRIKGKGSIDTAITLNNIGSLHYKQRNYASALENYLKCLEIKQRIKGKDSIDVAASLNNIGSVYDDQGNSAKALENYFKCLEIQQNIKGKGSIDTASTLNNIGSVYSGQGNYALALEYYLKCLEIKQRIKGKDSLDAASTLYNIGIAYKKQGKYSDALQYYKQSTSIYERLGINNQTYQRVLSNLKQAQSKVGQLSTSNNK